MECLTRLQGKLVGLDSALLIYLTEQNPTYLEMFPALFQPMNWGAFRVVSFT
jgi:hypothetical protein